MNQNEYWQNVYGKARPAQYDGWLDEYARDLRAGFVIELGCGDGADTEFLVKNRIRSVSCDFSETALRRLNARLPEAKTLSIDLTGAWPFADGAADSIIADLCLHYFSQAETRAIARKIYTALAPGGHVYARVNALTEYHPTPGDVRLEENYYRIDGCTKRFFDEDALSALFADYDILSLTRTTARKYGGAEKHMLTLIARKPVNGEILTHF